MADGATRTPSRSRPSCRRRGPSAGFARSAGRTCRSTGGFWAERLRTNRERTLPHAFEQLVEAGNLENFRLAAGPRPAATGRSGSCSTGRSRSSTRTSTSGSRASAWELGRAPDDGIARMADEAIERVAAAQRDDGYLNTFVQVLGARPRVPRPAVRATSCTASATWSRRRSRGTGRCGDDRLLAVARAGRRLRRRGPRVRTARDGHRRPSRRSRWRSSSCTG